MTELPNYLFNDSVSNATSVPDAPTSLNVVSITSSSVTLSWSDSEVNRETLEGYTVYMSETDNESSFINITYLLPLMGTTVEIKELLSNKTYFFYVTASNSLGQSIASNTVSCQTHDKIPLAPRNLCITNICTSSISISWSAPENNGESIVTQYNIYKLVDTEYVLEASYNASETSHVFTSLVEYTSYSFRINAINSVGEGESSFFYNIHTLRNELVCSIQKLCSTITDNLQHITQEIPSEQRIITELLTQTSTATQNDSKITIQSIIPQIVDISNTVIQKEIKKDIIKAIFEERHDIESFVTTVADLLLPVTTSLDVSKSHQVIILNNNLVKDVNIENTSSLYDISSIVKEQGALVHIPIIDISNIISFKYGEQIISFTKIHSSQYLFNDQIYNDGDMVEFADIKIVFGTVTVGAITTRLVNNKLIQDINGNVIYLHKDINGNPINPLYNINGRQQMFTAGKIVAFNKDINDDINNKINGGNTPSPPYTNKNIVRIYGDNNGTVAGLDIDRKPVIIYSTNTNGTANFNMYSQISGLELYVITNSFVFIRNNSNNIIYGSWGATNTGDTTLPSIPDITSNTRIYTTNTAFALLTSNGSVVTWGNTSNGGNSSSVSDSLTSGVVAIYSTNTAFAALKSDGSVVTWGNTSNGGNSSSVSTSLTGVEVIYSTTTAFAALKSGGSVVTWGADGGNSSSVSGLLTGVVAIYSTNTAFAALKSNGSVVTWGNTSNGGNSSSVSGLLTGVEVIYSTTTAFAALKTNGSVVTWGDTINGGDSSSVFDSLTSGVVAIYSTNTAFAALKSDGSVVTWGTDGGNSSSVSGSLTSGVVAIYSSSNRFVAVKSDGSIVTWGNNNNITVTDEYIANPITVMSVGANLYALVPDANTVTNFLLNNNNLITTINKNNYKRNIRNLTNISRKEIINGNLLTKLISERATNFDEVGKQFITCIPEDITGTKLIELTEEEILDLNSNAKYLYLMVNPNENNLELNLNGLIFSFSTSSDNKIINDSITYGLNQTIPIIDINNKMYMNLRTVSLGGIGLQGAPPDSPSNIYITDITTNSIIVNWAGIYGIDQYKVYIKTNNNQHIQNSPFTILDGSISKSINNLSPDTIYNVTVTSINGSSIESTESTPVVSIRTLPDAPTITSVTPDNESLIVTIDPNSNNGGSIITSYEYSIDNQATWNIINLALNNTLTITNLANGVPYTIHLRAINNAGSSTSITITGTPRTIPDAPTITSVTPDNESLIMTVNSNSNNGGSIITSYEYSINNQTTWNNINLALNNTLTITNLANGVPYTIHLRAFNIAGPSISTTISGTPRTIPDAPTITSVTPDNESLTVTFDSPLIDGGSTITSYEYSINNQTTWNDINLPLNNTFTITNLDNGVPYTIHLRAINNAGSSTSITITGTPISDLEKRLIPYISNSQKRLNIVNKTISSVNDLNNIQELGLLDINNSDIHSSNYSLFIVKNKIRTILFDYIIDSTGINSFIIDYAVLGLDNNKNIKLKVLKEQLNINLNEDIDLNNGLYVYNNIDGLITLNYNNTEVNINKISDINGYSQYIIDNNIYNIGDSIVLFNGLYTLSFSSLLITKNIMNNISDSNLIHTPCCPPLIPSNINPQTTNNDYDYVNYKKSGKIIANNIDKLYERINANLPTVLVTPPFKSYAEYMTYLQNKYR
jgi:hypothetical protein